MTNANAGLRWLSSESPKLDDACEAMRRIIRDANRVSNVISRVRALFKKAPTTKEPLDVSELIAEVVLLTRSEIQREGPRNLAISSQQVAVIPAESQDHAGHEQKSPAVAWIVVSVKDSGPGVDLNALNRLFEAFYTTKPHGLGVGLAISHSIIEAHGGQLWATANVPQGAVLSICVPRRVGSGPLDGSNGSNLGPMRPMGR